MHAENWVSHVCAELRSRGRRLTPQRLAILRALRSGPPHPTADDVIRSLESTMPDVSHATVYSTLHELVEMGLLSQPRLGCDQRTYDLQVQPHAHVICVNCGRIEDVAHSLSMDLPQELGGFRILEYSLTYVGLCASCVSTEEA